MGSIRFADLQTRPTDVLDLTSLTMAEFQQLVPPLKPRSRLIWPPGALMAGRAPPADTPPIRTVRCPHRRIGRSLFSSTLRPIPCRLCRDGSSGWATKQGPSADSCPAGRPAGGAARAGGCSDPLLDRVGQAPRGNRGRSRDHCGADGGVAIRSLWDCHSSGADLPSFGHDGTERRIERPQDPTEQTRCYRGKKRCRTVKNVLLINAALTILFLSETCAGSTHDKRIADATPCPLPAGSRLLQDLGFLAFTLDRVERNMPTRKPRGRALPRAQKAVNRRIASRRVRIEHVNSSVKRCCIVHDTSRLRKVGVRDLVMEVCCGWHNFRVRLTPWQQMI
jgi:DDE superfamily endonuclease